MVSLFDDAMMMTHRYEFVIKINVGNAVHYMRYGYYTMSDDDWDGQKNAKEAYMATFYASLLSLCLLFGML